MKLLAINERPVQPRFIQGVLLAALVCLTAWPARGAMTLTEAVDIAQRNDPWLVGSEYRQQAIEAQSTAAGTLPDPVVSVGFANLPTDTFDFDQEAMTQFKVGVSQTFPRGHSRALDQKRLSLLGAQYPYQRDDRRAKVAVNITSLWLEVFRATESIRLIEQDRALFEDLVDVAQSSYSTAVGRTRQQDLIRAQLELTRLEDRLTVLHERRDMSRAKLNEWLHAAPGSPPPAGARGQAGISANLALSDKLAETLPQIELRHPTLYEAGTAPSPQDIASHLRSHPAILSLDRKIDASRAGIELAEQKYRPQWSVNASYGYREDDPVDNPSMDRDRPDFFSFGVAFDLPLFTSKRQDRQVQSAIAGSEAVRTEKWLALRNMIATFETQRSKLLRLNQRQLLYQSRLLREMQDQAEASLTAYTTDDGDFSEVVRARIDELNARIDALDIEVDRLKTISQLNYFFVTSSSFPGGETS
ncbi:MAG: transporter [Gammaproteobacteria bacterium]|nr:MAG: transporter [Gammaproteobacteria bacterium]RLA59449.1 MAG: transporter [Gammaproteobacteria bacterium]